MSEISLSEFADKIDEMMPVMMRAFLKSTPSGFYKTMVTMPQFIVLDALNRAGKTRMTDLASFLKVTTAAATGLIDRLVRDGYVTRGHDPDDRRTVMAGITPKGARVVRDMLEKRKKATMDIFGMISKEEREEYLRILTHIRDHLKTA